MTARIDISEAKRRLSDIYPDLDLIEYNGINKMAKFFCNNCGSTFTHRAAIVINGKSSCKCKINRNRIFHPITKDYVDEVLKKKNIILISEYPSSMFQKVEAMFDCGHSRIAQFKYIAEGGGCGICRKNNLYKNKWPKDKIESLLSENNLIFMGFEGEYLDGSSKGIYICGDEHITTRDIKYIVKFPTCKQCKIISRGKMQSGSGSSSWKGGVSKIWVAARRRLDPWLDRSIKEGGRVCFITGQTDIPLDVHHITSFNIILKQVMDEFGFDENYYEKSYAECDGEKFLARVVEVNNSYGLGVVLRKDIHILYHKTYGHGNNTPAQFEEFLSRINSGEITLES